MRLPILFAAISHRNSVVYSTVVILMILRIYTLTSAERSSVVAVFLTHLKPPLDRASCKESTESDTVLLKVLALAKRPLLRGEGTGEEAGEEAGEECADMLPEEGENEAGLGGTAILRIEEVNCGKLLPR